MMSAKVFVVLLGLASVGLCYNTVAPLTLFDFTSTSDVSSWKERSDTYILSSGSSKSDFVLQQNDKGLRRAIFFALLNPQSDGFAAAGYRIEQSFDLSAYTTLSFRARAQGELTQYKIILRQDGQNNNPALSYQQSFEGPSDFEIVTLPLSGFAAYNVTTRVEGVVVNPATISSFGIAALTSADEAFQQIGTGSLEIDWFRAE